MLFQSTLLYTHLFDVLIKLIITYGSEIWGMFNPWSSKYRNGIVSFDQIYSKCPAEKLHLKFCKFIFGVHSKTTNIAVLSELGRFPLYFNIIKSMLRYYDRLQKSQSIFPLLFDSFEESKTLHNMKKVSWYTSVHSLIDKIKSSLSLQQRTEINSQHFKTYLVKEWEQILQKYSDSKLCTYILHKKNFGLEI